MDDVHATYEKMDASYVWQIALMLLCGTYEPEAASAGVRPTFQSPFTFLFISRKTVFDVFVSSQNHAIALQSPNVLCKERPDHKPLLPRVYVTREVFNDTLDHLPSRPPSFCWCPLYPKKFAFKDIFLVPVEHDPVHQLVYMVRVVKKHVYDTMPVHPKPCVVTLPVVAHVGGEEHVLLEEACFFKIFPDHMAPESESKVEEQEEQEDEEDEEHEEETDDEDEDEEDQRLVDLQNMALTGQASGKRSRAAVLRRPAAKKRRKG
jgi:hypothetical protein